MKMPSTKTLLVLASFGFAIMTFFATLALIATFSLLGIEEIPEEFRAANQISLGAVIASMTAMVTHLLEAD